MKNRAVSVALVTLVALASLAAWAGEAHAQEKRHHLGIGAGIAILDVADKSTRSTGPGIALHYTYQVADNFRLMTEFSSVIVAKGETIGPGIPHTRPSRVDTLGIGAGYVIDVLRKWVPYGGVMASGTAFNGGTLDKTLAAFGVQVAVGVEYMITSNFAVGFALRQHLILTRKSEYPSYYSGFLRAEFVWGGP